MLRKRLKLTLASVITMLVFIRFLDLQRNFGSLKKNQVSFLSYRHVTKSGRIYFIILLAIYIPGRNHLLIFRIFVFADKINA